jgi:hypothetical protein
MLDVLSNRFVKAMKVMMKSSMMTMTMMLTMMLTMKVAMKPIDMSDSFGVNKAMNNDDMNAVLVDD